MELGANLQAGVPYYGPAAPTAEVPRIRAALLVHYAANDPRINSMREAFEQAKTQASVRFESYVYPGTQHGFHNNSTPRYDAAAATLSWERTLAHFRKHLA